MIFTGLSVLDSNWQWWKLLN